MFLWLPVWCLLTIGNVQGQDEVSSVPDRDCVLSALRNAVSFIESIAVEGGYVYYYSLDLKERWGEEKVNSTTIEVQEPGTPAVGRTLLRAFRVTGEGQYLEAARRTAEALLRGQNRLGGWTHTIDFSREPGERVSFDDNQTQGTILFLIDLDRELDDRRLTDGIEDALSLMLRSQQEHGGWPHQYPRQGNYHDFATFNDAGINDCIRVMLEAHRAYGKLEYLESLKKAARFLLLSQLPPPQSGWAQQYNDYLQPAWARSFEPPSICPLVTLRNIQSLIDLAIYLGDRTLLEPIHDALRWVDQARLPNGKWARFIELGTGRPLYYDRGRIRVESADELSVERRTGYGYEQDLSQQISEARLRFESALSGFTSKEENRTSPFEVREERSFEVETLASEVREILAAQDSEGRWVTRDDRFRGVSPGQVWDGEYAVLDRISSRTFIVNVNRLCDYLELGMSADAMAD